MRVEDLLEAGRSAWPQLDVDEGAFRNAVEKILAAQGLDAAAAGELDGPEVWLAAACAQGDSQAIAAFRDRYYESVRPVVRQVLGADGESEDEAWQVLSEKLLVDRVDGAPRLLQYAGTGRLGGLVRVSALRWALTRRRGKGPALELSNVVPLAASDPEGKLLKVEHREHFRASLQEAAAALEPRQRNLLRLHHLRGIGVAELAKMYGVHRATMSRWLADARAALGDAVASRMPSTGGGLLQSQIDLSLGRLLATEP